MNTAFITRPIMGFFRIIGLWLWPKKIHLIYGVGGKGTSVENEVMDHIRKAGIKCTWYFLTIDGIWFRPNQKFFYHEGMKDNHRHTMVEQLAKKYNIPIVYFAGKGTLKKAITEYAAE